MEVGRWEVFGVVGDQDPLSFRFRKKVLTKIRSPKDGYFVGITKPASPNLVPNS